MRRPIRRQDKVILDAFLPTTFLRRKTMSGYLSLTFFHFSRRFSASRVLPLLVVYRLGWKINSGYSACQPNQLENMGWIENVSQLNPFTRLVVNSHNAIKIKSNLIQLMTIISCHSKLDADNL